MKHFLSWLNRRNNFFSDFVEEDFTNLHILLTIPFTAVLFFLAALMETISQSL